MAACTLSRVPLSGSGDLSMPDIHITRTYPEPLQTVWRAMTEPDLVAAWTVTGQGARPVGFEPRVGCSFRFVGKPTVGWDGIVRCEVLEVRSPELLRYSWRGSEDARPTEVLYRLEPA